MKFYYIRPSLNKKIIGHYTQVKNVIYHCDVFDNPLFIDRFHSEKINVDPIIANAVLHPKSNLTDLIDVSDMGFTLKKLISGKLKSILDAKKATGSQFFQCSVFKDGIEYKDYWLLYVYKYNIEYIDFSKSKISVGIRKKEGGTEKKPLHINTLVEYLKAIETHKEKMEIVVIDNLYLNTNVNDDFFFINTPGMYVVSEKLKKEIEDANCTGIEFQPIELSINEWLQGGEREKVYEKC